MRWEVSHFSEVSWQAEYLWFCEAYMFVCTSLPSIFLQGDPSFDPPPKRGAPPPGSFH